MSRVERREQGKKTHAKLLPDCRQVRLLRAEQVNALAAGNLGVAAGGGEGGGNGDFEVRAEGSSGRGKGQNVVNTMEGTRTYSVAFVEGSIKASSSSETSLTLRDMAPMRMMATSASADEG